MTTSAARRTTAAARKSSAPARKAPARRAARKTAPAAAAPAAIADAPKQRAAPADKATRADKPSKLKLVRDSFTIPKFEYGVLEVLKTRASHLGRPTKKSEVVRAGLKALQALTDADFLACLSSLPATKPARAAKS